ncbi:MAG: FAD/NAD(P)-binding oxidoreductase [Nitrososphaerales archaeon]
MLVAGGGAAGVAAVISAVDAGAEVTLAERSQRLAEDKRSFLDVLAGASSRPGTSELGEVLADRGVKVLLGDPVVSVDASSRTVRTRSGRLEYGALVLASGSSWLDPELRGASKDGVFSLRSREGYSDLHDSLGRLARLAIIGSFPLSLMAAQAVASRTSVSVFVGAGPVPSFTERMLSRVAAAASDSGVRVVRETVEAIVGVRAAEAVVAAGSVHPCDGVALLPLGAPNLPAIDCARGGNGGALVDGSMRTGLKGVYAAGECAEVRCGSGSLPCRLGSSSVAMGEAAGTNAAGGTARAVLSRCIAVDLFGVELCTAGVDILGAKRLGLDAVELAGYSDDLDSSLIYERSTRAVLGVQLAGRGSLSVADYASYAVSTGASLDDLLRHESPHLPSACASRSPISLTGGRTRAPARG